MVTDLSNKFKLGNWEILQKTLGIVRSVSQFLSILIHSILVHLPCESLCQIHTTQEREFSISEREVQRSSDLQSPIVQTLPLSTENIGKFEVNSERISCVYPFIGGGGVQQQKRQRTSCDFPGGMIFFVLFCSLFEDILLTKSGKNNKKEH